MLKMPQQQYIKFLREVEGLNINEISDAVNVDWRTAKKYEDRDDWNLRIKKKGHPAPVMDPFKEIVDTWLIEDQILPRKQRHTGKQIFKRLFREHHYTGSYRTISDYIRKKKTEMDLEKAKVYQRLEHPGGEAQVDFCTIKVSKESNLVDYKLLIMSFPYSNAAFVHPMPSENQECFLEGLKTLFIKADGVPTRIWFDNLSAAVAGIDKNGERRLRELFVRFECHYRFEAIFCNPNSGNEKGNVENKCGYGRRNWCVPVPVFESHEKLAEDLDKLAEKDMDRPHYAKGSLIQDLWSEEKSKLNKLPEKDFHVFRLDSAQVNKYGEATIDKMSIKVFSAKPGDEILIRLWWDRIEVLDCHYRILNSIPRPYTGKTYDIPWVDVFKGFQRKPRSVRHSQFTRMLPPLLQEYLCIEDMNERKERISALVSWCSVYSLSDISKAIERLNGNATVSMVTTMLPLISGSSREVDQGFEEDYTPPALKGSLPDLSRYNFLTRGGETA